MANISLIDTTGMSGAIAGRIRVPKQAEKDFETEYAENSQTANGDTYEFSEGLASIGLKDPYGIIKARDERIEQQKLTGGKGFLPEYEEPIDVFDNQAMFDGLEIEFNTGSPGKAIVDILGDTAINAYIVADDFVQKIQQTYYNRNGTIEERALNRELALKNGEQIAEKYLGGANSDKGKPFIELLKKYAANDELREKGWVAIDNDPQGGPYRPFASPSNKNPREVEAANYFYDIYKELTGFDWNFGSQDRANASPAEWHKFESTLNANYAKWTRQINDAFDAQEKAVADRINAVKKAVADGDYDVETDNRLTRLEKAMK